MTEKTARQIESLKNQTIGVEIEMNSITREKAAQIAADFFGTGRSQNTASRNGYSPWTAWDGRHAGAKSDASRGCGVHIHIGANGHTAQTLRNLANIMASHESLIAEALDLDHRRMSRYCRTVDPRFLEQVNKKKPTTMTQLADIWYTSHGANYGRDQH